MTFARHRAGKSSALGTIACRVFLWLGTAVVTGCNGNGRAVPLDAMASAFSFAVEYQSKSRTEGKTAFCLPDEQAVEQVRRAVPNSPVPIHSEVGCREIPLPNRAPLDWSQTHFTVDTISVGKDTASIAVKMTAGLFYEQGVSCTYAIRSRVWKRIWTLRECTAGPPSVI